MLGKRGKNSSARKRSLRRKNELSRNRKNQKHPVNPSEGGRHCPKRERVVSLLGGLRRRKELRNLLGGKLHGEMRKRTLPHEKKKGTQRRRKGYLTSVSATRWNRTKKNQGSGIKKKKVGGGKGGRGREKKQPAGNTLQLAEKRSSNRKSSATL